MSMIMDHYHERWWERWQKFYTPVPEPRLVPAITPEEVDEFRRLLDRARKYDRDNGEPDCELDEKKQRLKKLAEDLGVTISFP